MTMTDLACENKNGAMMPVTAEDVTNAYRWLLGREPHKEEVTVWLGADSRISLRRSFVVSREFRASLESPPLPIPERLPVLRPPNEIQWEADSTEMGRLVKHIQRTWNTLGKEKPYWSVLSADQFLPENIDAYKTLFQNSGAQFVDLALNVLHTHGVDTKRIQSVVEYGCGVGRVTKHLAKKFPHITAIDISESHMAIAQRACSEDSSVKFKTARWPDFGMSDPFDLWISYIVLQHNPPPIIAHILNRALSMLAPGGVAIFQVPTWADSYQFRIVDYLTSRTADAQIEVHCLPQEVIFSLAHNAGCVPLEVREDDAMKPPLWASQIFVVRKPLT